MAATFLYISRGPRELGVDRAVDEFRRSNETTTAAGAAPDSGASKPAEAKTDAGKKSAASSEAKPAKVAPTAEKQKTPKTFATPAPGVYSYDTKGYESTDAFSGQRHDYPEETTITLRSSDEGWLSRWQPLEERWEETLIREDTTGAKMLRYTMYHEFFRRGVQEDFTCDGYVEKIGAKPGDAWEMTCKSPKSKVELKVTFVGIETIDVGGEPMKAKHMRYDAKVTGANRGTMLQERWLSEGPRGMVRMKQKADLDVDSPFGAVGYKESFEIDLQSLEPKT
jgi:hypothetical protein